MDTISYSKAITIFEEDERFKAVERTKDRENLYEDYLVELGNKVRLLLSCNIWQLYYFKYLFCY